ncbi:MAG: hypothetical protein EHM36_07140, partial [Deltaproteobacteria bacterium]
MAEPLSKWITDYLCWMIDRGYSSYTVERHEKMLANFEGFLLQKTIPGRQAFCREILVEFFDHCRLTRARAALNGFMRYLDKEGLVAIEKPRPPELPALFAAYLDYYKRTRDASPKRRILVDKVLRDFNTFFLREQISINDLRIGDVDRFFGEYNRGLAPKTCQGNRSIVRGVLRFLHREHKLFRKDLSSLLKSAPVFNRDN